MSFFPGQRTGATLCLWRTVFSHCEAPALSERVSGVAAHGLIAVDHGLSSPWHVVYSWNQGSNLRTLSCKWILNHWTTKETLEEL